MMTSTYILFLSEVARKTIHTSTLLQLDTLPAHPPNQGSISKEVGEKGY